MAKCRFYFNELPEINEAVMVNITSLGEMGAYGSLIEYNNKECIILLSELSRIRIRSVNKLVRIGKTECVIVIRAEMGYIDLSKRRVCSRDVVECEERFSRAKAVDSILRYVADQFEYNDEKLEDLYTKTAWYFDNKLNYKTASYDVFKNAVENPNILDECNLENNVKEKLLDEIKKKLKPHAIKIKVHFELTCFGYEGIDAIKKALLAGYNGSPEKMKINVVTAPVYSVSIETFDKREGQIALDKALLQIEKSIKESRGNFKITESSVHEETESKEKTEFKEEPESEEEVFFE